MTKLGVGDVIQLPVGLRCYHNQAQELTTIESSVIVVIESTWPVLAGPGSTNHFEAGRLCAARALNADGSYFSEGALLTVALSGDFKSEYILPESPNMVLRRMVRTFLPKSEA